jgi:uncharacterized membrane protein
MRRRTGHGLAYGLAALLGAGGLSHFLAPSFYRPLIPSSLGAPDPWVYGSGLVELTCAGLVAIPRTRRGGAYAAAVLFVVVFPGNVQMALDAGDRSTAYQAAAYLRLPLQVPLVIWALAVARGANEQTASPPPR